MENQLYRLTEDMLTASDDLYAWRAEMRAIMEPLYLDPEFATASDQELLAESLRRVGDAPLQATTAFMNRLADAYLSGTDESRRHIRSAMSIDIVMLNFVHTFIYNIAEALAGPEDAKLFRRAVAAASIEENHVDSSKMTMLLNQLIEKAKDAEIDTDPHLNEIADYSSAGRSGRSFGFSMQEFIRSYVSK